MSTIAVNAITNAAGGNTATINGMTPTADSLQGFRNRLINPGMVIDQRNAGASVANPNGYTLDRWYVIQAPDSKLSFQQNAGAVTPPTGFSNYLGITSSSSYSVGTDDVFGIFQKVEGFNFADLAWGTANAQTVTLSFWVRSSLTGTFGGSFQNSAQNRSYPFSYTISAANTWEQKTVTVAGDTSGTWIGATNGTGVQLNFGLGAGATYGGGTAGAWAAANKWQPTGATSVVGTSGATFYITGVQLEAGSVATPFERRPYGTELALCQRYYQQFADRHMGLTASGSQTYAGGVSLTTTMRATPTLASGASFAVGTGSAGTPALNQNATAATSSTNFAMIWNSASNWTTGTYVEFNGGLTSEL